MKKAVNIFEYDHQSRHYYRGPSRITLDVLRRLIARAKPFKVYSRRSGKDMTAKAIAHALAYQYVKKRRFLADTKKAQQVLAKA